MKRVLLVLAILVIALAAFEAVRVISGGIARGYLKTTATQELVQPSPDGRSRVVAYRYPEKAQILGFAQGLVQLQEAASGRVLAQKETENVAGINVFRWSSNTVAIYDFAEWKLSQ